MRVLVQKGEWKVEVEDTTEYHVKDAVKELLDLLEPDKALTRAAIKHYKESE